LKIKEKKYLKDKIANIIFTDESCKEYVESVVSAALNIPLEIVKDNLILKTNRINNNLSTKYSYVDAIYENNTSIINIEINYNNTKSLRNKNMRYVCQLLLKGLNNKEIKFYTYLGKNAEGKEILQIVHINDDGTYSKLNDIYYYVRNATTSENTDEFSAKLEIDNEIKSKLKIKKTDSVTGETLKNIKFTLSGKGKNGEILTTDSNGEILVSGLWVDEEYVLKEVEATGYYLEEDIIFKVLNNNGKFELLFLENSSKPVSSIEDYGDIPIVNFNITNKKIPTYALQLTKYAKDETVVDESGIEKDKILANAQYRI